MTDKEKIDKLKQEAAAKQLIRKSVLVSDLRVISKDSIDYKGLYMQMSNDAFKDLARILGLTIDGANKVTGKGDDGAKIMNEIKNLIGGSAKGKQNVVLGVNKDDRSVQRIFAADSVPQISQDAYFDVMDRYMNSDNWVIDSTSVDPRGNITMNLLSNTEFDLNTPRNMEMLRAMNVGVRDNKFNDLGKEIFKSGVSARLTERGINMVPFNLRLVCTNGMMTSDFGGPGDGPSGGGPGSGGGGGNSPFLLRKMGDMDRWLGSLSTLKSARYLDPKFEQRALNAMSTPASLAELEHARDIMTSAAGSKLVFGEQLAPFAPVAKTMAGYASAGIDLSKLTPEMRHGLRTAETVWTVVNGLTDFASHKYNGWPINDHNRMSIKIAAGKMLMKKHDCATLVAKQAFN